MNKSPCKGCTKRIPGCHAYCKEGIEWDNKERERKSRIAAARKVEQESKSTIIKLKEALKRR